MTYTPDQQRVADYLVEKSGIGGGDDPVGFILAAHATLIAENRDLHEQVAALQSKEVCNAPHNDDLLEGCPYCRLEAALHVINSDSTQQSTQIGDEDTHLDDAQQNQKTWKGVVDAIGDATDEKEQ